MNPNCKPNSPPDTVILFETKAGWNQYGGTEPSTLDNHEPKSNCPRLGGGKLVLVKTRNNYINLVESRNTG